MIITTPAIDSEERFRRNFGGPCGVFMLLAVIGCAWLSVFVYVLTRRKWGPYEADADRRFVANITKILESLKRMK